MPVPTRVQAAKNIWIAAGDGDLERVRELIEGEALSPNVPDPNSYTPMHAAASYGHLEILTYLISKGGDVNVTDDDGDTPLYTVENIETARFLVEHGAVVARTNHEGVSPIDYLAEDFPEVSTYLQSLTTTSETPGGVLDSAHQPSQHAQHTASENLTSSLLASAHDILQRAEAEGRDPEEELRRLVGQTVLDGMVTGYGMGQSAEQENVRRESDEPADGVKRPRTTDDTS
ncbi:ankyrin [Gloeophyllum trabeum ATCC 11539]|uniref:Ankyrin n=1 Tax=Gloeophyllum trabeum (strain ATCC 11539 / FP-39264 / Madison 617) TaxID=670483 RepID=S7Q3D4_GLOTA|nr:ankyrin [Gloeophyllum trabeum ATCC 11539]EPQ54062.1 ankyrin [Gloeophyllum trabeum ATCC 11539]